MPEEASHTLSVIWAERKSESIRAMIGPLLQRAGWLNGILLKVEPELRAVFCLPVQPTGHSVYTGCLCSCELSKCRSSLLRGNLCACRKGHKGMSNVISGNRLRCVMLLSDLCQGPIISSYCVLVKIKRRLTRESISNELADRFRGQTELCVLEDGSL